MTPISPKDTADHRFLARLAQVGVALALAQIAAAVWIGVAVAGRPRLEAIDCDRMIRPHASGVLALHAAPVSRHAAAGEGLSPLGLGGLEVESRLGVVGARRTC
jgi:hypothetical protein